MEIAGQIHNFASENDLKLWETLLSKTNPQTFSGNDCHGVNEDHKTYKWLVKHCFEKIKIAIGDEKLKVVFGMYLNETNPWKIHTDAYHVENYSNRTTAISFLMPLMVNNNVSLVNKTRTIVFNEHGSLNDYNKFTVDTSLLSNSAVHIHNEHLSQNKLDIVKKFTVYNQYQWIRGSLIWWKSDYFHASDNFIANGFSSKQAIVIHTYYDC